VLFTQDARADVTAASDWYEERAPGLSARFRAALDLTVQRIAGNPLQFQLEIHDVRRAFMRRFPYTLLFRVEPATLQPSSPASMPAVTPSNGSVEPEAKS